MNKMIASIATLALVAGQATVASAATKDTPVPTKVSTNACAVPSKPTRLSKIRHVENRCDVGGVGVVPLVFGGAIVAGVVAVGVVTNDNNSATSP